MTEENKKNPCSQSNATSLLDPVQRLERAEQKAQSIQQSDLAPVTHDEIQQRLHELHVKQLAADLQIEQLRRQLEERDEQAALFRIVTENMLDMVALTDMTGNFIFAGKSHEILGYELGSLIGKNVMDFVHPEDLPHIVEEFAEFVATGHPRRVEYRNRCEDGTYLWLETMGNFIKDENGIPQKIVFSSRDIAERKRMEMALRESEQRFKTIIQNLPGAVFVHDLEGRLLFVNKTASINTDYAEQELLSMSVSDIDSGNFTKDERYRLWNGINIGKSKTIQSNYTRKDGSKYPVEVHLNAICLDNQPVILSIVIDITDRIKAEEDLRKTSEKLQAILDHSPLLISEFDTNGSYRVGNPAIEKLFNLSSSELIGKTIQDLLPPDTVKIFMERVDKIVNTRESLNAKDCLSTQEGELYFNTTLFPLFDSSGMIRSIGVIAHDVSDRKHAEDALRASEKEHRRLFETMAQGVVYQNADGEIISANPAAESILGLSFDQMRGKTSMDPRWKMITEDGSEVSSTEHPSMVALRTGQTVGPVIRGVFHPDKNTHIWLSITAIPLFQPGDTKPFQAYATFEDITERKQAEEARRGIEEKFRHLFEKAIEGILIVRGETLEFVNPALQSMLGHSMSKITSEPFVAFIHPDDREAVRDLHFRMMQYEFLEKRYDFRVITPDKTVKWVTANAQIIDWEGAPANLCFVMDITDRKQAEQELKESEERFSKAFRSSPAPQVISDIATGEFIDVNHRWMEMLGYTREQMIGRSSKAVGIWVDPGERGRIVVKLQKHGSFKDEPIEFRTSAGKIVYALWSAEAIMLGNRHVMLSMIYDRTERKHMEDALHESEQRLGLALDAVSDGVWDWRIDSDEVYFSPRWYTMLGYEPYELPEEYDTWRRLLHSEDRSHAEEVVGRHLTSTAPFEIEFRMKTSSGGFEWILARGKTVEKDEKGYAKRMLGIHSNITERKHAEKEREKLQSQLNQAQKMESVGRLAGGVAHDFNNKLAIINGYAEMAAETIDPSDPLYEMVQEIHTAGKQSAGIVRQLLAFARQQTISPVLLDLNDTIASMLKMLQRLIGENIDLAWHPGNNLWPVKIDPSQVDQIMVNLAVNSRDAISDVGKLTIETKNTVIDEDYCKANPEAIPGRYVMLAVSDDGHGIEKEVKGQLFEPFFTTKAIGKGTGLGLSTIYGILKQNKGFVNVYSESGEGTTFKLYLPSHETEKPSLNFPGESSGEMPMGTESILIVEDEKAILQISRRMLERLGYTVQAAGNPSEALRFSEEYDGAIDLLITDVIMPEMNGRDLSSRLMQIHPGLKTLYMSGYTANVIAHHGVLDEGVQFIQKPFSLRDLAVKVRKVIEQG